MPATVEVIPVLPCEEEEEIAAPRLAEDNTPAWMPYAEGGEEEAEEGQEPPCADDPTLPPTQQRVYIRADSDTAYRNIVRAMNRLQDKGFTKIGLVAEDRR